MLVRMWMSTELATASPEMPVGEALNLLSSRKIRRLPILSQGEIVGIVTLNELQRVAGSPSLPLKVVMMKNPATVSPDAPIEEAGMLMRDRRIGAVPVVEGKKLVGLITETDVFRALLEVLGLKIEGTRIAVELGKEPRDFYELMRLVGESDRAMLSVVLYPSYGRDKTLAVLRVEGAEADDLVQKLWDAKYRVVQVKEKASV